MGCAFKNHEQDVLIDMDVCLRKIGWYGYPGSKEKEMADLKAEMKKIEEKIPNVRIKSWLITFDHRIVRYRELRAKYNKLKEKRREIKKCYKIVKTGQANIEGITTFVNHFGFDAEKCRSFAYKVYDKARYEKVLHDVSIDPEEKAKVKEPEVVAPEKIEIEIDPNVEETKEIKNAIEEEEMEEIVRT